MYYNTTIPRKRRTRGAMSPQERQDKMMQGVVPCMSFQHFGSKPSRSVVDKLRIILDAGDISQKQIAFENLLRCDFIFIFFVIFIKFGLLILPIV